MEKYFIEGFTLKRYFEDTEQWSDGNGSWIDIKPLKGHLRALKHTERGDITKLKVTHRFYTKEEDILYGDKIQFGQDLYKVKLVDKKRIQTSEIRFLQVDCEVEL